MSHTSNTEYLPPEFARNRLLTAREAAAICNYSVTYFRALCRIGSLPKPIKIEGAGDRWSASALLNFIEEQAKAAA